MMPLVLFVENIQYAELLAVRFWPQII